MRGIIEDYDKSTGIGYIKGYDDDIYLFRQRDVIDNVNLKKGDIVEFKYRIYNMEELPIAERIKKEK